MDILDGAAWKATISLIKKSIMKGQPGTVPQLSAFHQPGKEDALSAVTHLITVLTKFAKLILPELLLPGKIVSGE